MQPDVAKRVDRTELLDRLDGQFEEYPRESLEELPDDSLVELDRIATVARLDVAAGLTDGKR